MKQTIVNKSPTADYDQGSAPNKINNKPKIESKTAREKFKVGKYFL